MGFEPLSNGMSAHTQLVVPTAVTLPPLEFSHVTDSTPTLSDEVPVNAIAAPDVETLVSMGDVIVRVGAVVSFTVGGE